MEPLSDARVAANLRRFKKEGLSPNNPDHVRAYLIARRSSDRVRADHIWAILNSSQVRQESSARISVDFWIVPAGNLPKPLPADVAPFFMAEDALRKSYRVPVETGWGDSIVLDAGCPRKLLGKGVRRMTFEEKLSHSLAEKASASSGAAPPVAGAVPLVTGAVALGAAAAGSDEMSDEEEDGCHGSSGLPVGYGDCRFGGVRAETLGLGHWVLGFPGPLGS